MPPEQLVRIFKALGNENRLKILETISRNQGQRDCRPEDIERISFDSERTDQLESVTGLEGDHRGSEELAVVRDEHRGHHLLVAEDGLLGEVTQAAERRTGNVQIPGKRAGLAEVRSGRGGRLRDRCEPPPVRLFSLGSARSPRGALLPE